MSASDYLIKNCPSQHPASECPTAWSRLKTSFSDAVRHCSRCNRKVYLCLNEQDVKFYSSLKYPIAVDGPEAAAALANLPAPGAEAPAAVLQEQAASAPSAPNAAPSVWRRNAPPAESAAINDAEFPDMPAFMRMRLQSR
jgi:hypothetical protein